MLQIWLIMSVNWTRQLVEEFGSSTVDQLIYLMANLHFIEVKFIKHIESWV